MLTVLAAHRAGLVVAVFPLLWRQAELVAALNRISARAIVTTTRVDGVVHADIAMNAAAEAFSIRHVCGFGTDLPEGMASLDQVHRQAAARASAPWSRTAARPAIISFDVTADGFRAVPRTHLSLIAGGLAISLESDVPQGANLMSAFVPASFAGLASSFVVWLLSGGSLALHHPFDSEVLEQQLSELGCDTLIAPAQLALRLDECGLLARLPNLRHVIGMWRAPEQVASSPAWTARAGRDDRRLSVRRGRVVRGRAARPPDGTPGPVQAGAARRATRFAGLLDRRRGAGDPERHPRPARADGGGRSLCAAAAADRFPDRRRRRATTSIPTMPSASTAPRDTIAITAPPAGVMAVGGYRFLSQDLHEWSRRLGQGALLTALPDRLSGHRLAGRALDNARAREALAELGLNPLMVEAFRDRASSGAA